MYVCVCVCARVRSCQSGCEGVVISIGLCGWVCVSRIVRVWSFEQDCVHVCVCVCVRAHMHVRVSRVVRVWSFQ